MVNIYAPNKNPKIYEAKTDRSKCRNSLKTIAGDFNISFSIMNRSTRQKGNKEIECLNIIL
jgi:hypothetical protein